jgi:hypothetical protein
MYERPKVLDTQPKHCKKKLALEVDLFIGVQ